MSGTAPIPAVSFSGIRKAFGTTTVLSDVDVDVEAGRVLALVGENGAGKSTLMNILGGNVAPDAGSMRLHGAAYAPTAPRDAQAAGIAFVHQELNLFANLTIAENLSLGAFPTRRGLPVIDRGVMTARARELMARVGLSLPPDMPVERLSAGERQLVEIARALGMDARVLILDEPTTSLSAHERERLYALVGELRARGLAIVYISHDLADVLRLCDDLVVLRDGAVVGRGGCSEFTIDRLITLMVGREVSQLYPVRPSPPSGTPALEVRGLTQPGVVRDVSFDVGRGEVVGLAGLMGAGRSELARILFGLDPAATGEVRLEGRPLAGGPRRRIRRGLAFVTEDRRHEGLLLDASIADNMALVSLSSFCDTPARLVSAARLREAVARFRSAVRLSPGAADTQAVRTLSGGNQQKVVLARWLMAGPKVLILDEPTRGVDVGARAEIYQLVADLAAGGAGILVISSEIEELIGLCDRILVIRKGEVGGSFAREAFDRARLLEAALPEGRA